MPVLCLARKCILQYVQQYLSNNHTMHTNDWDNRISKRFLRMKVEIDVSAGMLIVNRMTTGKK